MFKEIYKNYNTKIVEDKDSKILYVDNFIQMIIPKMNNQKNSELEMIKILSIFNYNIDVLNIGLGAGLTLKGILENKNINKVDTIEIYKEVIDGLSNFDTYNIITNDKRSTIINDCGYNYIKNTDKKYDIIFIDVCHPQLKSSESIYGYDFLSKSKSRLKPNGIISFWYFESFKKDNPNNTLYIESNKHYTTTLKNLIINFEDLFRNFNIYFLEPFNHSLLVGSDKKYDIYILEKADLKYIKNKLKII